MTVRWVCRNAIRDVRELLLPSPLSSVRGMTVDGTTAVTPDTPARRAVTLATAVSIVTFAAMWTLVIVAVVGLGAVQGSTGFAVSY